MISCGSTSGLRELRGGVKADVWKTEGKQLDWIFIGILQEDQLTPWSLVISSSL